MKNYITYLLILIFISGFLFSCSTSIDVAKRRYNSGFYVDISSKKQNVNKNIVQSKSVQSNTVNEPIENAVNPIVEKSDDVIAVNQPEIKNDKHSSYLPNNKKEKISSTVAAKPVAFASAIMAKTSKAFVKTNSSGLQSTHSTTDARKDFRLWLIFLIVAIVLSAIGAGFLAWLAWIAFLVFFILWLIALAA